jgi:deazaflavin-dependent oxidoreductase (nitroreductase family)
MTASTLAGRRERSAGPACTLGSLESAFFRALNRFWEPAVRAGLGSPGILPSGLIVLETAGRRSGRPHRVPLAAAVFGPHIVVATLRPRRSDWLRNAVRDPDVRYWLLGREHAARAKVITPDLPTPDAQEDTACLARALHAASTLTGAAFAILRPR